MKPRVKVCGITQPSQIHEIALLSVDAIGCIHYANSPRNVSIDQIKDIFDQVPPFLTKVLVVVDEEPDRLNQYCEYVKPDYIQLHGSESIDFCKNMIRPVIKAISMKDRSSIEEIEKYLNVVPYVLVDTYHPDFKGGTGLQIPQHFLNDMASFNQRIILSGGISPDNISQIKKQNDLWAIDINSGVETSPGIKDIDKIKNLLGELYS